MIHDRKKPGVAFWATVVVVAVLVGYPLSFVAFVLSAESLGRSIFPFRRRRRYNPDVSEERKKLAWAFAAAAILSIATAVCMCGIFVVRLASIFPRPIQTSAENTIDLRPAFFGWNET